MKSYKKKSKSQKLYNMRGCAKKTKKNSLAVFCPVCGSKKCYHNMKGGCGCNQTQTGGRRRRTGGDNSLNLGYSGQPIITVGNPNLGYTGNIRSAYPVLNTPYHRQNWINSTIKGGASSTDLITDYQSTGKYPDGLVGNDWTASPSTWPGVDNAGNHYPMNTYDNDVQTQMINTSAQPPGSVGGRRRRKKMSRRRYKKGGSASNTIAQDFINFGRQFSNSLGTTYNALNGYAAPVSPMPWKGQLANTQNVSSLKY
jgi:hypothetical protein